MVHASILFYTSLISGSAESVMGEQKQRLCITQFGRFFATCRIPHTGRDEIKTFEQSRHIVVICRNQFFSVTVLEEDGMQPLPQATLNRALQEIKRIAADYESLDPQSSWKYPVGVLTTLNRDVWAAARIELVALNPETVATIDSAILVLCLDDDEPQQMTEFCDGEFFSNIFLLSFVLPQVFVSQVLLHNNDGSNRWFDKNNLVVCANGKAGVTMEHSAIDGSTMLVYLDFMYKYARERAHEALPKGYYTPSTLKPLSWKLNRRLRDIIFNARVEISSFASTLETELLEFTDFGELLLKKSLSISPDAFVQIAFQAAYYRLKGKCRSTYESAQTKRFFHGRTEVIRSVTPESVEFAEHMSGPYRDSAELLRAAVTAHRTRIQLAGSGLGVDRHLLGLKTMALCKQKTLPGYDIPQLFTDPLYSRLTTSVLSTSNCGSKSVSVFTFGPVCDEGLGLGYVLHRDGMQISVTSFKGEAKSFAQHLKNVLIEMRNILEKSKRSKL